MYLLLYVAYVTKNMANIGTFLIRLSSILIFILGNKKLKEYFCKIKIESAFLILREMEPFIDDITQIVDKGYLNDKIRRDQLILNKFNEFKNKIHQSIIQISGKKSKQIHKLVKELEKYCKELSYVAHAIYEKNKEFQKLKLSQETQKDYHKKLKSFYEKTEKILKPIIQNY
ncbi:hypothetical protein KAT08_03460 [Candidatus Babeliales bacterium]|nr:hypothetical protein [Candidatus Babeliales bacterium]